MTATKNQKIAASLRDQVLDVRIGVLTKAEWDRRCDEAVAQGVTLPATLQAFRESKV